jgi:hypothetical protein
MLRASATHSRQTRKTGLIEPKTRNPGAASGQARITPPSSSRRKKSLQSLSRNPDRDIRYGVTHAGAYLIASPLLAA